MSNPQRVVGILAGGGTLPAEIAACAVARGEGVHIIPIEGEADGSFDGFPHTRVTWGQLGGVLRALRNNRCTELLIVGRVTRPDLRTIVPDLGFVMNLPRIYRIVRAGGDDSVLSRVIQLFEGNGVRVVGPIDVAPELLVGEGGLTEAALSSAALDDAARGFAVIAALARYDIGQSLVIANGRIEAIEGVEGTDAMLERVSAQRHAAGMNEETAPHGVFVKSPKPGQELRVDLPAIGPETVTRVAAARLEAIVVEADRVLAAQRSALVALARQNRVAVHGLVPPAGNALRTAPQTAAQSQISPIHLTRIVPDDIQSRDIAVGVAILATLHPVLQSRAVVVVRKHVLAVEAGEGTAAVLSRAAGLRQWGSHRRRARAGVTVLARADDIDQQTVTAAAQAGLAGIAFFAAPGPPSVSRAVTETAAAHNMFIVALSGADTQPG